MNGPPESGLLVPLLVGLAAGAGLAWSFRSSRSATVFRLTALLVGAWSLFATTVLVWVVVGGGARAIAILARSPAALFAPGTFGIWALGAFGAFLVFCTAFALCQAVGRSLLHLLGPRPLPWPARLPVPSTPTRLLAFASVRPDAFTFTLLRPSRRSGLQREEIILVSDGLVADLTPDEWEAVVAHELGHVRELDGRYLTFFRTFARMMRWDPILAVLARSLTRREEFRADDDAVALTGRPRALARAIYKSSRHRSSSPGTLAGLLGPGGARGRQQAAERILRLMALAESGAFDEEPVG
jgi:Zn-dependent protease with chaperone function